MESQPQQPESDAAKSPNAMAAESSPPSKLLPPPEIQEKWWWQIGTQVAVWLSQLPDYLGRLFKSEYKQQIISVALILAAIITLKVVLAVMDALNDLPLLAPTLELIGVGYSAWFVYRYLLRTSTRQELFQTIQVFLTNWTID